MEKTQLELDFDTTKELYDRAVADMNVEAYKKLSQKDQDCIQRQSVGFKVAMQSLEDRITLAKESNK